MMRRLSALAACLLCAVLLLAASTQAQDGLNLPTELYVLLNEGRVQRFGIGSAGVDFVTPEDEFVLDFRVAPDGNWLAYRTQSGLFIRDMYAADASAAPQQIVAAASVPAVRGQGETIAWSPESDAIAYTTLDGGRVYFLDGGASAELGTPMLQNLRWSPDGSYLAAEANENIWWIFRREAAQMTLTSAIPGAYGVVWLNLTDLLFLPLDGGMIRMDLADGNRQTPVRDDGVTYFRPYLQRDGSLLAFRSADGVNGQLLQVPLTSDADPVELSAADAGVPLQGLRWGPDGSLLVAFRGGVLALVDPLTGQGLTLPISTASAYSWGADYPNPVVSRPLPAAGYFLAEGDNGVVQVWRMTAAGDLPRSITAAEFDITQYALSPDASRIAYVSNSTLWAENLSTSAAPNTDQVSAEATAEAGSTDANAPVSLVELGLMNGVAPAFGPDNSTLYYHDEQGDDSGIWQIDATATDSGPSLWLADTDAVTYRKAIPSTAVSAALVEATLADGDDGLLLVDTVSGERNLLGNFSTGAWLAGADVVVQGRLRLQQDATPVFGLHVIDVNNLAEPPLTVLPLADDSAVRLLDFVRLPDGSLRALTQQSAPGQIRVLDVPLGGSTPELVANVGYLVQPRLSPDGSTVAGSMHPHGALLLHDVATNSRVTLSDPKRISAFRWR